MERAKVLLPHLRRSLASTVGPGAKTNAYSAMDPTQIHLTALATTTAGGGLRTSSSAPAVSTSVPIAASATGLPAPVANTPETIRLWLEYPPIAKRKQGCIEA